MKTLYHPKGSMCSVCVNRKLDCANLLDFNRMPVMSKYSPAGSDEVFKVVKCSMFNKESK